MSSSDALANHRQERGGDVGRWDFPAVDSHGGRRVARRARRAARTCSRPGSSTRSQRQVHDEAYAARLRRGARGRQGRGSRRASHASRRSPTAFAHPFQTLERRSRTRSCSLAVAAREPSRASRDRARSGVAARARSPTASAVLAEQRARRHAVLASRRTQRSFAAKLAGGHRAALRDREDPELARGDLRVASGSSLVDGTTRGALRRDHGRGASGVRTRDLSADAASLQPEPSTRDRRPRGSLAAALAAAAHAPHRDARIRGARRAAPHGRHDARSLGLRGAGRQPLPRRRQRRPHGGDRGRRLLGRLAAARRDRRARRRDARRARDSERQGVRGARRARPARPRARRRRPTARRRGPLRCEDRIRLDAARR